MKRRSFIKTAIVASATGAVVTSGLIKPEAVMAASHEKDLTTAKVT